MVYTPIYPSDINPDMPSLLPCWLPVIIFKGCYDNICLQSICKMVFRLTYCHYTELKRPDSRIPFSWQYLSGAGHTVSHRFACGLTSTGCYRPVSWRTLFDNSPTDCGRWASAWPVSRRDGSSKNMQLFQLETFDLSQGFVEHTREVLRYVHNSIRRALSSIRATVMPTDSSDLLRHNTIQVSHLYTIVYQHIIQVSHLYSVLR